MMGPRGTLGALARGDGGKHGERMRPRDGIGAREIADLLIETPRRILCFAP